MRFTMTRAHRAARAIIGGERGHSALRLRRLGLVLDMAIHVGYRFGYAGMIMATPECPSYVDALRLREQIRHMLQRADDNEERGLPALAWANRVAAQRVFETIPPRWLGVTAEVMQREAVEER